MRRVRVALVAALLLPTIQGCYTTVELPHLHNLGDGQGNATGQLIGDLAERAFAELEAGRCAELTQQLAPEVQKQMGNETLLAGCQAMLQEFGALRAPRILEIHAGEVPGPRTISTTRSSIAASSHSDILGYPVSIRLPVAGEVAVVLGGAELPSREASVFLILTAKRGRGEDWAPIGLHLNYASYGGHDGNWHLERAKEFEQRGMTRNAFLYRGVAAKLLAPSPQFFVPPIAVYAG